MLADGGVVLGLKIPKHSSVVRVCTAFKEKAERLMENLPYFPVFPISVLHGIQFPPGKKHLCPLCSSITVDETSGLFINLPSPFVG